MLQKYPSFLLLTKSIQAFYVWPKVSEFFWNLKLLGDVNIILMKRRWPTKNNISRCYKSIFTFTKSIQNIVEQLFYLFQIIMELDGGEIETKYDCHSFKSLLQYSQCFKIILQSLYITFTMWRTSFSCAAYFDETFGGFTKKMSLKIVLANYGKH